MNEILRIGATVATPLGAVGLFATLLVWAYRSHLQTQEKKLQSLPDADRAKSVDSWIARLGLKIDNLTREQKYDLVCREMERRDRFSRLVVLILAVVIVVCFGIAAAAYVIRPINGNAETTNADVVMTDSEAVEVNRPPVDFPSSESFGIPSLSDAEWAQDSFKNTKLVIQNETDKPLKLSFAYKPRPGPNPTIAASRYVQRESPEVLPGEVREYHEENFGGHMHISIFADRRWTATNKWHNLGVVARRLLVVTKQDGVFNCRVEFEEE